MEKKQSETGANRTERGNMACGTPGVGGNWILGSLVKRTEVLFTKGHVIDADMSEQQDGGGNASDRGKMEKSSKPMHVSSAYS